MFIPRRYTVVGRSVEASGLPASLLITLGHLALFLVRSMQTTIDQLMSTIAEEVLKKERS